MKTMEILKKWPYKKFMLSTFILLWMYLWIDAHRLHNAIKLSCDWKNADICIVPINRVYWQQWDKIFIKSRGSTLFGQNSCDEMFFTRGQDEIQKRLDLKCFDDEPPYYYVEFKDKGYLEINPDQTEFAVFNKSEGDTEMFHLSFYPDEIAAVKARLQKQVEKQ